MRFLSVHGSTSRITIVTINVKWSPRWKIHIILLILTKYWNVIQALLKTPVSMTVLVRRGDRWPTTYLAGIQDPHRRDRRVCRCRWGNPHGCGGECGADFWWWRWWRARWGRHQPESPQPPLGSFGAGWHEHWSSGGNSPVPGNLCSWNPRSPLSSPPSSYLPSATHTNLA